MISTEEAIVNALEFLKFDIRDMKMEDIEHSNMIRKEPDKKGLVVYDEETAMYVRITKKDIEKWVKEAVKENM